MVENFIHFHVSVQTGCLTIDHIGMAFFHMLKCFNYSIWRGKQSNL